jgi:hypothetical protein
MEDPNIGFFVTALRQRIRTFSATGNQMHGGNGRGTVKKMLASMQLHIY